MLLRVVFAFVGLATAVSANAQSDLAKGFAGALRGCEEWVLDPGSWADSTAPFVSAVNLGAQMSRVETVNEAALPPPDLRVGNHYWRINSTDGAGYILVVSDRLPMCHITGGGNRDLQPIVKDELASTGFQSRWEKMHQNRHNDMVSTKYRNLIDPSFTMIVSYAQKPGQSLDRVQVLATATFDTGR